MDKYRRYEILVSAYRHMFKIDLTDNYWDTHEYAFILPGAKVFHERSFQIAWSDPRFCSYSDMAAETVAHAGQTDRRALTQDFWKN